MSICEAETETKLTAVDPKLPEEAWVFWDIDGKQWLAATHHICNCNDPPGALGGMLWVDELDIAENIVRFAATFGVRLELHRLR